MPTYTPNHDYQLFADGEHPWGHRPDFQSLDTDVEVRDTNANRTNYTAKINAKYLATDTGHVYIGDGTSWIELGVIGASSGGGSSGWTQTVWTATESGNTASRGSSVWVNTSGGNVTVNLPTPAHSAQVRVKHTTHGGTGNDCLVSPNGTESIDGNGTDYPVPYNATYTFESDGTNWETF